MREPTLAEELRMTERRFAALMKRVPKSDQELHRRYYLSGEPQRSLAADYGVSQAAISCRLRRLRQRLRFFASVPLFEVEALRSALEERGYDAVDVNVMCGLYAVTSQSEAARQLGMRQSTLRSRFAAVLASMWQRIVEGDDGLAVYHTWFWRTVDERAWNRAADLNWETLRAKGLGR